MGTSTRPRGIATFIYFWNGDEGLVTLESVGLAAAVVVLAVGAISVIQGSVNTTASTIGTKVVSTQDGSNAQPDGARGQCSASGLVVARDHANGHASLCQ